MRQWRWMAMLLATVLFAACSDSGSGSKAGGGDGTPKAGKSTGAKDTIVINVASDPSSLDPNLCTDVPASKVLRHLFEGLIRLDDDMTPIPGMAEKWEHNADSSVWTFHLRKDAKWSNGDPVTAKDFVYAYRRILDPGTGAQYAYMVHGFLKGGVELFEKGDDSQFGAKAIDDHTLVLELVGPTPHFIQVLGHTSWYPLHRGTIEKNGTVWANTPQTFVGNGPFTLQSYKSKDRIVAAKNPNYWAKDEVKLNTVVFRMIESESTEYAGFVSGEIDITDKVPMADIDNIKKMPEYTVRPYIGVYYVIFNMTRPPFDKKALRQAASLVMRNDLICDKLLKRGDVPAEGFVPYGITLPDGTEFRSMAGKLVDQGPYDQRVAKAKKLLADAGIDASKIPQVEYLYNTSEEHKAIGEALQPMWENTIGLKTRLTNAEFKVRIQRGQEHDFDVMRAGWIADVAHPINFLDIWITEGGNNDAGFSNEKYDELIEASRKTGDLAESYRLLAEAEKILMEEAVIAPVYFYKNPYLMRGDIKNCWRNALGDLDVSRAWRE